jgi:hypothetical protein
MLTQFKTNRTGTKTTVHQTFPGRRKLLGTIRTDRRTAATRFMAATPLTAAQLDTVQVIMAGCSAVLRS